MSERGKATGGAEAMRWVRYITETYTTPEQFKSPQEYLKALTEALDALTASVGREPPLVHDVWSHRG